MKNNYSKMTKDELLKRIDELEKERNAQSAGSEKFTHEIHEKDLQLEKQKRELTDKENQFRETQDNFADFYDYAPICCVTLDEKNIIKDINLTAAELIGAKKSALTNKHFVHFLASSDMRKFVEILHNCSRSYESVSGEFNIKTEKRKTINIHLTAVPFHEYKKNKIFTRIFFTDITKQKKSENEIIESEKRFRLMADSSAVMIWMTDINNRLEYINATKLAFLGKKSKELTNEAWLQTRHPKDRTKFIETLTNFAKQMKGFSLEIRVKDKDGNYRWILDSAAPRFLNNGTFIGFIGSGVDITESKNTRIRIEKSLHEKEILMKEVHHRVKNNLQVVSSLLNLQSSYIKDKESLSMFKASQARVRSMALLHEKLYRSSNITEIDLNDYINDLLSNLLSSYNTVRGIELKLDVADIHLDIGLSISLGLIINELVSNALKHAFNGREKGEINLSISQEKDRIKLIVKDDGIGIGENKSAAGGLTEAKTFGLELVGALVEQYNGSLEINNKGKTEFIIYLQCKEESVITHSE